MGERRKAATVLAVLAMSGLAACGSPQPAREVAPARMERLGHNGILSVVLTPLGASRIGIQTAPGATAGRGAATVIPSSALLYEPDGRTVVYVATGRLTYTRQYVAVRTISGSQVFLASGLARGAHIVTVGAEELLGVQNGVGVQR